MKTLLLTIALLVGSLSVSNAEWTKVSETVDGNILYVDFERIRKNGGYVYFWDLMDNAKPTKHGDLSSIAYRKADCNVFRYKYLKDSYYTEPMGRGSPSTSSNKPDKDWSYPPPDSAIEAVLESVCSQ